MITCSIIIMLPNLCIPRILLLPTMSVAPDSTTVVMAVTRRIPAVVRLITSAAVHPFKSAAASLESNHVV